MTRLTLFSLLTTSESSLLALESDVSRDDAFLESLVSCLTACGCVVKDCEENDLDDTSGTDEVALVGLGLCHANLTECSGLHASGRAFCGCCDTTMDVTQYLALPTI